MAGILMGSALGAGVGAAITAQTCSSAGTGVRTAGYRINSSGIIEARNLAVYTTRETWLLSGVASDYEARYTVLTGSSPTGSAVGSYIACNLSPEWDQVDSVIDSTPVEGTGTVDIRRVVGSIPQTSATIYITADRS